jgi:sialate O-acetylesterase
MLRRRARIPFGLVGFLAVFLPSARADVKLPAIFSDHMVLQREMRVPIWGTAAPGEKVTVKFRDQQQAATADKDGKWTVKLDPLAAGGPEKLVVTGTNTVTIEDVLVGEVWVGSGQSNMAGGAGGYARRDEVLAAAIAAAPYPRLRLLRSGANARWQEASAQSVKGFSALLLSFGLPLHKELNVPVGLMVGAVGGTPSGRWLSKEALAEDAACQAVIKKYVADHPFEEMQKKYEEAMARWQKAAAKAKAAGKRAPRKPRPPQKPGDLSKRNIGQLYEAHIRPLIPYGIRGVLWDQGESGTAVPEIDQYTIMGALIRGWRKDWGQGEFPFLYVQKPSGGGCAWDKANPVTRYADAFASLPPDPTKVGNGLYRELHIRIMQYPNTAMVISSDLGPGIHPINKSGYGARACQVALGMVYGRKAAIYGPLYDSHKVEGSTVRITFKHVGQGLAFRHGDKLQGFAIAGEDRAFHWANAKIDGDTVVVSSDKVASPVAVRYAWAQKRPWANLFNKDGLPAVSFRTDQW